MRDEGMTANGKLNSRRPAQAAIFMKPFLFFLLALTGASMGWSQEASPQQSIGLTVSFPWVNNYVYRNYELQRSASKSGFAGFGASVYFLGNKHKYSLHGSFNGSSPVPVGPIDFGKEGTRTTIMASVLEGIWHKKVFGNVNLVSGINYMKYRFEFISYVDTLPSYTVRDRSIGLTVGGEYRIHHRVAVGIFYRPSVIAFDEKQYRHLITLDARFDLRLFKF